MITGKWITGGGDLSAALEIRKKVLEEQGAAPAGQDAYDGQAMHVIMYDGEMPVATGRLYFEGTKLFMGCICVLKEYRGQSIGDLMVRLMIFRGFEFAREIRLRAQREVQGFFERYGFAEQGEPAPKGGRMHVLMVLEKQKAAFPSKCVENCAQKLIN